MHFVSQRARFVFNRRLAAVTALTGLLVSTAIPAFAEPASAFEQGRERMSHRDYDGALSSFGEAIGFSSENPKTYMYRGECYFHMKRFQDALTDFSKSISIDPNFSEVYLWRGNTYGSLNQDDNAVSDYQQAMKLDPNLAKQYFAVPPEKRQAESQPSVTMVGRRGTRGEIGTNGTLLAAKKPVTSHAIDLYKKAMETAYPNGLPADIAATPGIPFTAPVVALPVTTDDASKKPATITSTNISLEETTGTEKKRAVTRAKKVDEKFDQVAHDKFKKDIDQYTEAMRGEVGNANNYYHRGRAHQYLQEYPQAVQDFSDAIRLSPQNSQFYLARAAIYMLMKKPLMSKADVKSAQSVDPTVPTKVTLDLDPPQP